MLTNPNLTSVYTDLNSLQHLKGAARQGSPEALEQVARQFEALFMQEMLKSMRQASLGDGPLDSDQGLFYRDLFDQQLALNLAQGGHLGIAELIARQLGGEVASSRPVSTPPMADSLAVRRQVEQIRSRAAPPEAEQSAAPSAPISAGPFKPSSPEAFVRGLWSHAQDAARQLGVTPEVLIAQAALETGWGRSVPRFADGRSSHNLFGIKAHGGWQGERVVNATLEFEEGLPVRRRDGFRAYASYAESFADYADFIRSNPRYAEALRQADDGAAYLRELQRAGYATDPHYAAKIQGILDGNVFGEALENLKMAAHRPISLSQG